MVGCTFLVATLVPPCGAIVMVPLTAGLIPPELNPLFMKNPPPDPPRVPVPSPEDHARLVLETAGVYGDRFAVRIVIPSLPPAAPSVAPSTLLPAVDKRVAVASFIAETRPVLSGKLKVVDPSPLP